VDRPAPDSQSRHQPSSFGGQGSSSPPSPDSGAPVVWFLVGLGCVGILGVAVALILLILVLPAQRGASSVDEQSPIAVTPTLVEVVIEPSGVPTAAPPRLTEVAPTTTPVPTYTPPATATPAASAPQSPEIPPTQPVAELPTVAPPPAPPRLNKIVFTSMLDGQKEIYVMDADGANLTRLTNHPAEDLLPAWSPDGSEIAFVSDRDGNPEIYAMNADGTGLRRLTNHPGPDYNPAWSPNGAQIAFDAERDVAMRADIWIMNEDGAAASLLQPFGRHPSWSPDAQWLVAQLRFGGMVHLGTIPVDGSNEPTPLLQSGMNNYPDWSPDGARIVFDSANAQGTSDIMVINADGSNLINLTNSLDILNVTPRWSPGGQRIVFASDRDGSSEIYVMNADGSSPTRLTNTGVWNMYPDWSP
jgi:Tol biopolymer transport system component